MAKTELKVFLNIKLEDFDVAFKNLDLIYDCGYNTNNVYKGFLYIRLVLDDVKDPGWGDMSFFNSECSKKNNLFSKYEYIDYYEWYKENEVILTAKKFGLY